MKDSTRWQQQQQHPHNRQQQTHHRKGDEDDGGWSTGVPESGSGWSAKPVTSPDISLTGEEANEQGSWGGNVTSASSAPEDTPGNNGRGSTGGSRESDWLSVDSASRKVSAEGASDSEMWRSVSPGDGQGSNRESQNESWVSDGSQSAGDTPMLLPPGIATTAVAAISTAAATASTTSSSSDTSNGCGWGVGSNWKDPDHLGDDSPLDLEFAKELELYNSGNGGNSRPQEGGSDWDELDTASLSSNDRDHTACNGDSTGITTATGADSRKSSQETNPGFGGSQGSYSAKTMGSGLVNSDPPHPYLDSQANNGSPSPLEGYRSPDFRASEGSGGGGGLGWRGNLGSSSSVNSVGSSSSWKSDGKGVPPRGYPSKPSSPRKPGR